MAFDALPEHLDKDEFYTVFDKLKKDGKVRFLGISVHNPQIIEVINKVIDIDKIDIIQPSVGALVSNNQIAMIQKAAEKGKAIAAMKTLNGAFEAKLTGYDKLEVRTRGNRSMPVFSEDFSIAGYKWALANPNISTVLVRFNNVDSVNTYINKVSGAGFSYKDKKILEYYGTLFGNQYCRVGCGECLSYCPYGVPINDILRYRMYFENYHEEKEGITQYLALADEKKASRCSNCDTPCQGSCTYGIDIRTRLLEAHDMLTV